MTVATKGLLLAHGLHRSTSDHWFSIDAVTHGREMLALALEEPEILDRVAVDDDEIEHLQTQ